MAYQRIESAIETGLKIETTEGTAATLTSADFIGDWKATLIQPKLSTQSVSVGGSIGVDKIVSSKEYGEISSFKMPASFGLEGMILRAAGAFVSGTTYYLGGDIYAGISATDKGRLTNTSLTVSQYDGKELHSLVGARLTSCKIGAKNGEVVYVDAGLQGNYTESASTIAFTQKPSSTGVLNVLKNSTLSLAGTPFGYTDIEIDFKPELKSIEDASTANGYSQFEITNLDPTITVQVYPGDPAVKNLYTMMKTNTPIAFSWTFGVGAGNIYTVSGNVAFESQESPYNNAIQTRKLVLKPVFNPATNYKLAIAIS